MSKLQEKHLLKLLDKDQNQMLNYIIEYIQEKECIDYESTMDLILNSAFISTLKEDTKFVAHYNPEYWGDLIIQQNKYPVKSIDDVVNNLRKIDFEYNPKNSI